MEWRYISGYENRYAVSSCGEIKNVRTGKVLKQTTSSGYYGVVVKPDGRTGKPVRFRTHRVVAEAFVFGRFEGAVVNHIDGDKSNNHQSNLEWCSQAQNMRHAVDAGLHKALSGMLSPVAKLTDSQVEEIRKSKLTHRQLSVKYNVHHVTIGRVKRGERYCGG